MERRLFGTDGIRGTANTHPMTAEVALSLGKAAGKLFRRGDHPHLPLRSARRLSRLRQQYPIVALLAIRGAGREGVTSGAAAG
jgi:hypothetical protein